MTEENPTPKPPNAKSGSAISRIAIVIALMALAATGWQWLENLKNASALQQTLTQRLSEFSENSRESLIISKHAAENATQADAKITVLQEKINESRAQQEALQTLYQELANNRDEWAIAEVEQLLIIASQQLQLAGNVRSALLALQAAATRLQQIDKPRVIQLRKAIDKDIQKIQALPTVDIVSMNLKLDSLIDIVDKLTLISERHPKAESPTMPDWDTQPWRRLTQEVWQDIKRLVRIERMDQPEPALLAPDQTYFLRENIKLRLLAARIALLQHDDATYHADLRRVDGLLKRYFDANDSMTQEALGILQQLSSSGITIDIPDVSESLNAVSKYKLSFDGGTQ